MVTGALLLSSPFIATAQENYSVILDGNYTWNDAAWIPSGIPGADDTITDISSDSTTSRNFYLGSDRELVNLTVSGLNGSGTVRFMNSNVADPNTPNVTFDITDTFKIHRATALRSLNTTGRLTVKTTNLVLESGANNARFLVGEAADYVNVTLEVSGTTTLKTGNTAFELRGSATSATKVDLGDIVFENSLSGGSPGIDLLAGTLRARSLTGNGSAGTIRGAGTLVLYGDDADTYTFDSRITGGVRVEKTGSNIQIFNPIHHAYSGGTLISGGVLAVNNTTTSGSGLGSGAVTVANNGTLAGRGSIIPGANNHITVEAGGTIAPSADGQAGFSNLIINNFNNAGNSAALLLEMQEGSAFTFKVDAEGNSDHIVFAYYNEGSVVFEGEEIVLNITGTLAEGQLYKLFSFRSGGPSSSELTASGLSAGLIAGSGFEGYTPTFHYDEWGAGEIIMTVTAIPETSATLLLLLPLAITVFHRNWQAKY